MLKRRSAKTNASRTGLRGSLMNCLSLFSVLTTGVTLPRADPLGSDHTTTPNPITCRHYQAITRVDGADGTPFFLVTRSGNTPETPGFNYYSA